MNNLTKRIAFIVADNDPDCGERYGKLPSCGERCHCMATANEIMDLVRGHFVDPIRELRRVADLKLSDLL